MKLMDIKYKTLHYVFFQPTLNINMTIKILNKYPFKKLLFSSTFRGRRSLNIKYGETENVTLIRLLRNLQ